MENYLYKKHSDRIVIEEYRGQEIEVVIPEKINDAKVVEIG